MISFIALLVALVAAVVLMVTGFGWFGSSTANSLGWLGLALVGIVVSMLGLDARIGARRGQS